MPRTLACLVLVMCLLAPAASAERWLVERLPNANDVAADDAWLSSATELLLRADLAELKGLALLSKSDVKGDIASMELNHLSSAKGDVRRLLGKFARAKGLLVIEASRAGITLTVIDLTQAARETQIGIPLKAQGLEGAIASAAIEAAKFLSRPAAADEAARMKRPTDLGTDALEALAKAYDSNAPAERELMLKQATTLAPKAPLAWYLYAGELLAGGRALEAISAYRSAIKLDDATAVYHFDLGNAFFDDKRYDEAVAEYGRAIALDPTRAEAHENLVRALKAKKLSAADIFAQYRALTADDDRLEVVHVMLGRGLAETGKMEEAVAEFRKAADIAPDDPIVHFDLAHALERTGKETEAFYEYKTALDLAPNYAKAFNNLGYLYEKMDKLDLALYYYAQAVKYAPDYAVAWNNLGVLYGKRDKPLLAIDAFRQQARITPKDPVAWYNLGVALHQQGEIRAAVDAYKKVLALSPDDKPTHWQLAHAYERENAMNLAADEWRKVLALNPTADEKATAEKHLKQMEGK